MWSFPWKSKSRSNIQDVTFCGVSRDSIVGITTRYGLDGPGIESRWGVICRTRPDKPWGPHSLLYNGYWLVPRGKAAGAWR